MVDFLNTDIKEIYFVHPRGWYVLWFRNITIFNVGFGDFKESAQFFSWNYFY